MDVYVSKELSLNAGLSIETAAPHCAKLLSWLLGCLEEMQTQRQMLKLNYADIECMCKASLYLNECEARFGEALAEAVLLQPGLDARDTVQRYLSTSASERIRELCSGIVGTREGQTHAPLLLHMNKAYADVQPAWSDALEQLDWAEARSGGDIKMAATSTALRMRRLVTRLFRLPNLAQIETALQRALPLVGFEVWLLVLREPKQSVLHSRCYVLRQMICDMLSEGVAPSCDSFVRNICSFVGGEAALPLVQFGRCLAHARFAGALMAYLCGYWTRHLPHVDLDELQLVLDTPEPALPLDAVLYLTHLMLGPKSACRSQFYAQLGRLRLASQLQELLNKVAYVYS